MRRWVCVVVAFALGSVALLADSPLTSTDLASAYAELPAVIEARATKRVAGRILPFLVGRDSNDRKAAVVNALGWQTPGNAAAFLAGVAAARGVPVEDLKLADLTAADRFVLGYLRAMETYDAPAALRPGALDVWGATPLQLLDQAAQALPDDFAVHYVRALVDAQRAVAESGCSGYLATQRVLEKFPGRRRNLRPAAVASAQSYMELYKADCAAAPTRPRDPGRRPRLTAEHDQNYALARLGDTIVAATQAGVVIWHPDEDRPIANRDEKICASVLVWGSSAWVGCYGRLVRWDGSTWKAYLQDPARSASAYHPFAGPNGLLFVRNEADVWRYDPGSDGFARVALNIGGDPFDILFRRNDELWRIEFLKGVAGPRGEYQVNSESYPGGDPRKLVEDASGRLWVLDFKSGALRFDDASGRFAREPGVDEKGSGVAADAARGRTWLLHYTDGPIYRDRGGIHKPADLRALEFMRDLIVDDRSGDVWIAGWTGLARLREDGGRWKTETLRARNR